MPTENKQVEPGFDLNTPDGGRGYIANLFKTVLKRHDYRQYIAVRLAGDFACTMAQHVERITAERDALQLSLNAADQRIDELANPFQSRVLPWLMECFGPAIASDRDERNHRFLEEALELVQACGATSGEAHQLVEYVYGRDIGEPAQEVGGVMVTLAALCLAHGMDMHAAGDSELARIWTKVDQIRAKQAAKPSMSPLPGAYPERSPQ